MVGGPTRLLSGGLIGWDPLPTVGSARWRGTDMGSSGFTRRRHCVIALRLRSRAHRIESGPRPRGAWCATWCWRASIPLPVSQHTVGRNAVGSVRYYWHHPEAL